MPAARPCHVPAGSCPVFDRRAFVGLGVALAASLAGAGTSAAFPPAPARASEQAPSGSSDSPAASPSDDGPTPAPSPADDFYEAVNHDLLASWEIPAGESEVSTLTQMRDEVRTVLDGMVRDAARSAAPGGASADAGTTPGTTGSDPDPDLRAIGALYATGMDVAARNAGGFGTLVEPLLQALGQAQTPGALLTQLVDAFTQVGLGSLLALGVSRDPTDATRLCLFLGAPDLGPGKEVWLSEDPSVQLTADAYQALAERLWEIRGVSPSEAARIAADVTGLMRDLAPSFLSTEELYDPSKTSNLRTVEELSELLGGALDAERFCAALGLGPADQICMSDVGALEAIAGHLTPEGLPLLREYAQTCLLVDAADYASEAAAQAKADYLVVRDGLTAAPTAERALLDLIEENDYLGFYCARPFCAAHFPERAKQDVAEMAAEISAVFGRRIDGLDWMADATKQRAKRKLETLDVRAGYPDVWPQDLFDAAAAPLFPEEGGLFVDNVARILGAYLRLCLDALSGAAPELPWYMVPQAINAFYDPAENAITVLAGMLQSPVYDVEAPREQNLGGIGFVIAHEISHAFDSDGAQYDELGNVADWWEPTDYEHFQHLGEQVAAYYDGYELSGRHVNGQQTLGENIADLGAAACVTQIGREEQLDLGALYEAYARLWASKMTEAALADKIATDVHAPAKIRVNAVLSATDEFYGTFAIRASDAMYQPPESRPKIW